MACDITEDAAELVERVLAGKCPPSALRGDGLNLNRWLGPSSRSPLLLAVRGANPELVQLLLQRKASPEAQDERGVRALHLAAFDGRPDIVGLLLDARASVDPHDRHGQTPLFFAANRAVCERLAQAGADLNAINDKGQTALHLAAHGGCVDSLLWLIAHCRKGMMDTKDQHGRTPGYMAHKHGKGNAVAALKASGADVRQKPLHRPGSHRSTRRRRERSGGPLRPLDFKPTAPICAAAEMPDEDAPPELDETDMLEGAAVDSDGAAVAEAKAGAAADAGGADAGGAPSTAEVQAEAQAELAAEASPAPEAPDVVDAAADDGVGANDAAGAADEAEGVPVADVAVEGEPSEREAVPEAAADAAQEQPEEASALAQPEDEASPPEIPAEADSAASLQVEQAVTDLELHDEDERVVERLLTDMVRRASDERDPFDGNASDLGADSTVAALALGGLLSPVFAASVVGAASLLGTTVVADTSPGDDEMWQPGVPDHADKQLKDPEAEAGAEDQEKLVPPEFVAEAPASASVVGSEVCEVLATRDPSEAAGADEAEVERRAQEAIARASAKAFVQEVVERAASRIGKPLTPQEEVSELPGESAVHDGVAEPAGAADEEVPAQEAEIEAADKVAEEQQRLAQELATAAATRAAARRLTARDDADASDIGMESATAEREVEVEVADEGHRLAAELALDMTRRASEARTAEAVSEAGAFSTVASGIAFSALLAPTAVASAIVAASLLGTTVIADTISVYDETAPPLAPDDADAASLAKENLPGATPREEPKATQPPAPDDADAVSLAKEMPEALEAEGVAAEAPESAEELEAEVCQGPSADAPLEDAAAETEPSVEEQGRAEEEGLDAADGASVLDDGHKEDTQRLAQELAAEAAMRAAEAPSARDAAEASELGAESLMASDFTYAAALPSVLYPAGASEVAAMASELGTDSKVSAVDADGSQEVSVVAPAAAKATEEEEQVDNATLPEEQTDEAPAAEASMQEPAAASKPPEDALAFDLPDVEVSARGALAQATAAEDPEVEKAASWEEHTEDAQCGDAPEAPAEQSGEAPIEDGAAEKAVVEEEVAPPDDASERQVSQLITDELAFRAAASLAEQHAACEASDVGAESLISCVPDSAALGLPIQEEREAASAAERSKQELSAAEASQPESSAVHEQPEEVAPAVEASTQESEAPIKQTEEVREVEHVASAEEAAEEAGADEDSAEAPEEATPLVDAEEQQVAERLAAEMADIAVEHLAEQQRVAPEASDAGAESVMGSVLMGSVHEAPQLGAAPVEASDPGAESTVDFVRASLRLHTVEASEFGVLAAVATERSSVADAEAAKLPAEAPVVVEGHADVDVIEAADVRDAAFAAQEPSAAYDDAAPGAESDVGVCRIRPGATLHVPTFEASEFLGSASEPCIVADGEAAKMPAALLVVGEVEEDVDVVAAADASEVALTAPEPSAAADGADSVERALPEASDPGTESEAALNRVRPRASLRVPTVGASDVGGVTAFTTEFSSAADGETAKLPATLLIVVDVQADINVVEPTDASEAALVAPEPSAADDDAANAMREPEEKDAAGTSLEEDAAQRFTGEAAAKAVEMEAQQREFPEASDPGAESDVVGFSQVRPTAVFRVPTIEASDYGVASTLTAEPSCRADGDAAKLPAEAPLVGEAQADVEVVQTAHAAEAALTAEPTAAADGADNIERALPEASDPGTESEAALSRVRPCASLRVPTVGASEIGGVTAFTTEFSSAADGETAKLPATLLVVGDVEADIDVVEPTDASEAALAAPEPSAADDSAADVVQEPREQAPIPETSTQKSPAEHENSKEVVALEQPDKEVPPQEAPAEAQSAEDRGMKHAAPGQAHVEEVSGGEDSKEVAPVQAEQYVEAPTADASTHESPAMHEQSEEVLALEQPEKEVPPQEAPGEAASAEDREVENAASGEAHVEEVPAGNDCKEVSLLSEEQTPPEEAEEERAARRWTEEIATMASERVSKDRAAAEASDVGAESAVGSVLAAGALGGPTAEFESAAEEKRDEEPRKAAGSEALVAEELAAEQPDCDVLTLPGVGRRSRGSRSVAAEERARPPASKGWSEWQITLTRRFPEESLGFAKSSCKAEFEQRRRETHPEWSAEAIAQEPGPQALLLTRIRENGLLHEWNRTHPEARARSGDMIVEVNGRKAPDEMLQQLQAEFVELRMVRWSRRFVVTLDRRATNAKVGFKFGKRDTWDGRGADLKIKDIAPDGALELANQQYLERGLFNFVVFPDMCIEACNGEEGDAEKIAVAIKTSPVLHLRIRRSGAAIGLSRSLSPMSTTSTRGGGSVACGSAAREPPPWAVTRLPGKTWRAFFNNEDSKKSSKEAAMPPEDAAGDAEGHAKQAAAPQEGVACALGADAGEAEPEELNAAQEVAAPPDDAGVEHEADAGPAEHQDTAAQDEAAAADTPIADASASAADGGPTVPDEAVADEGPGLETEDAPKEAAAPPDDFDATQEDPAAQDEAAVADAPIEEASATAGDAAPTVQEQEGGGEAGADEGPGLETEDSPKEAAAPPDDLDATQEDAAIVADAPIDDASTVAADAVPTVVDGALAEGGPGLETEALTKEATAPPDDLCATQEEEAEEEQVARRLTEEASDCVAESEVASLRGAGRLRAPAASVPEDGVLPEAALPEASDAGSAIGSLCASAAGRMARIASSEIGAPSVVTTGSAVVAGDVGASQSKEASEAVAPESGLLVAGGSCVGGNYDGGDGEEAAEEAPALAEARSGDDETAGPEEAVEGEGEAASEGDAKLALGEAAEESAPLPERNGGDEEAAGEGEEAQFPPDESGEPTAEAVEAQGQEASAAPESGREEAFEVSDAAEAAEEAPALPEASGGGDEAVRPGEAVEGQADVAPEGDAKFAPDEAAEESAPLPERSGGDEEAAGEGEEAPSPPDESGEPTAEAVEAHGQEASAAPESGPEEAAPVSDATEAAEEAPALPEASGDDDEFGGPGEAVEGQVEVSAEVDAKLAPDEESAPLPEESGGDEEAAQTAAEAVETQGQEASAAPESGPEEAPQVSDAAEAVAVPDAAEEPSADEARAASEAAEAVSPTEEVAVPPDRSITAQEESSGAAGEEEAGPRESEGMQVAQRLTEEPGTRASESVDKDRVLPESPDPAMQSEVDSAPSAEAKSPPEKAPAPAAPAIAVARGEAGRKAAAAKEKRAGPKTGPNRTMAGWSEWRVTLRRTSPADSLGFAKSSSKAEFEKRRREAHPELSAEAIAQEPGPQALVVTRIREGGLMHEWNRANPDARVGAGDTIVEVNGRTTSEDMVQELQAEVVELRMVRWSERFVVTLDRRANMTNVGFKFGKRASGDGRRAELKIKDIALDGALEFANRHNIDRGLFHLVVFPGMCIEACNGEEGDAEKIAHAVKVSPVVHLRIRRGDASIGTHRAATPHAPPSSLAAAGTAAADASVSDLQPGAA